MDDDHDDEISDEDIARNKVTSDKVSRELIRLGYEANDNGTGPGFMDGMTRGLAAMMIVWWQQSNYDHTLALFDQATREHLAKANKALARARAARQKNRTTEQ